MDSNNPFEPTLNVSDPEPPRKRSVIKRILIGFLMGSLPPAMFGVYLFYSINVNLVESQLEVVRCGNILLGPIFLVLFIAPVCGLIGSGIALVLP